MKKSKIIFIVALVIFIILLGVLIINKSKNNENSDNFKEVSFREVKDMFDNKEDFVLCITQTTCSHCATFKPKLEKLANEYDIEIYYMEADLLSKEEQEELPKYVNYRGTPVTVFIKNGEEKTVATRISGDISYEKAVEKFKDNGFID